jgi:hypothetical protein
METENIKFCLEDKISNTSLNLAEPIHLDETLINLTEYNNISHYIHDTAQLEMYYKTTCNAKALVQILSYYGIYKTKMLKDEMLQVLVFFETDPVNAALVARRIRRWQYIEELKTDSYFSKYIMF